MSRIHHPDSSDLRLPAFTTLGSRAESSCSSLGHFLECRQGQSPRLAPVSADQFNNTGSKLSLSVASMVSMSPLRPIGGCTILTHIIISPSTVPTKFGGWRVHYTCTGACRSLWPHPLSSASSARCKIPHAKTRCISYSTRRPPKRSVPCEPYHPQVSQTPPEQRWRSFYENHRSSSDAPGAR